MKLIDKVYSVKICEYNGNISSQDFCYINHIIGVYNNLYSLEDALIIGKEFIRDYCYNIIFKNTDADSLPNNVSNEEFELFISNKLKENKSYAIIIEISSGNRKLFDTSKELMEYFNNNIKNVSNEDLYDFLLSLVLSESRMYDYSGKFLHSEIWRQCPILERGFSSNVDFNKDDCLKGIYTFKYEY